MEKKQKYKIEYFGKKIIMNPDSHIFLLHTATLNNTINNSSRKWVGISKHLEQHFRAVYVQRPDLKVVFKVFLMVNGFNFCEILERKFLVFLELCEQYLKELNFNQENNDISLKIVKKIVDSAGLKLNNKFEFSNYLSNSQVNFFSSSG